MWPRLDFSSFLTSMGTLFIIFVVLILLFTWLSRKHGNAVVYYPNRILKELDPVENGYATRNPFAWIREASLPPKLISSECQALIRLSTLSSSPMSRAGAGQGLGVQCHGGAINIEGSPHSQDCQCLGHFGHFRPNTSANTPSTCFK
ncbi:unnamed protein product [Cuscuta europaea]|uniref:CSC1/OSCA1-like N-terminal transmembrane domain-containing protein n=1 Tax=Cuscuta europaea TaxID=41803 RepID=A0A9P0ZST9_CUSEU|nr:unnamed protein product [Cuscuta europaea]